MPDCPICFQPLGIFASSTRLACKHEICLSCLLNLRQPTCPLCRADIPETLVSSCDYGSWWSDDSSSEPEAEDDGLLDFAQDGIDRAHHIMITINNSAPRFTSSADLYSATLLHISRLARVAVEIRDHSTFCSPHERTTAFVRHRGRAVMRLRRRIPTLHRRVYRDARMHRLMRSIWEVLT